MKKVGMLLALIAAPVAAQDSQTTCYRLGAQVICNTQQQPTVAPPRSSGPNWAILQQGATPTDIARSFDDGVRQGKCDQAVREQNQLAVQAYCR